MNIMEAVKKAEEGKRVLHMGCEAVLIKSKLFWIASNREVPITVSLMYGWTVFEKKHTLSDMIYSFEGTHVQFDYLYVKDTKKRLNEFIEALIKNDFINTNVKMLIETRRLAKEILGKRLI